MECKHEWRASGEIVTCMKCGKVISAAEFVKGEKDGQPDKPAVRASKTKKQ